MYDSYRRQVVAQGCFARATADVLILSALRVALAPCVDWGMDAAGVLFEEGEDDSMYRLISVIFGSVSRAHGFCPKHRMSAFLKILNDQIRLQRMSTYKISQHLSQALLILAACFSGLILGYFVLEAPIISFSIAEVHWPMSILKKMDLYLFDKGAQYLLVASMIFMSTIPNVVLVAITVSLAMKYIQRPRIVFYSTLIWPAIDYSLIWIRVIVLKEQFSARGVNSDIWSLIKAENMHAKMFGMFLVYVFFSLVVFFVFRLLSKNKRGSSAKPKSSPADFAV